MTRRRVLVVIGTRPEAIKLTPVIVALQRQGRLDVRVLATGQHGALLDDALALHGVTPDLRLRTLRRGQPLDALLARLLREIGRALDADRPDRVVVQGDTASAYAATLAAYHRAIPVAHVEAGLRTGDLRQPWPEEGYRRAIAAMAGLHFAPTATAAAALTAEGHAAHAIHLTGNTVVDALYAARARIIADPLLVAKLQPIGAWLGERSLITVTAHRRENLSAMDHISAAVLALADRADIGCVVPLHPNRAANALRRTLARHSNVTLTPPLDYHHFVGLLDRSRLVLTDSGGVQEEAVALGRPVIVMRQQTERPEGVVLGLARLVGTCPHAIAQAAHAELDRADRLAAVPCPYGDGQAGERIATLLAA